MELIQDAYEGGRRVWNALTGAPELKNVIAEQDDIRKHEKRLAEQKAEGTARFAKWASAEDDDLTPTLEKMSEIEKTQSDAGKAFLAKYETEYMGKLKAIVAKQKKMKSASKAAEKATKYEKTAMETYNKAFGRHDALPNDDPKKADSKKKLEDLKANYDKASADAKAARKERDAILIEFKNFKNSGIKQALQAYTHAYLEYYQTSVAAMKDQLALVDAIPDEVEKLPNHDHDE